MDITHFDDNVINFNELQKPKQLIDASAIRARLKLTETVDDSILLEEHDQFYRDHNVLLWLFIGMGIYPIERTKPGTMSFRWWSLAAVYAYVIFTFATYFVVRVAIEKVNELVTNITISEDDELRFDDIVYSIIFVVLFVPHFSLPFMGWMVSRDVAVYKNSWAKYQFRYFCVTGTDVKFPFLKILIIVISVGCLLLAIATINILCQLLEGLLRHQTWVYYHIFTLINMNICLWYINCRAICNAGDDFSRAFKREMKNGACAFTLYQYRYLWLKLHQLIVNLGGAYTRTYTNYLLFLVINIILSLYGFVSPAIEFDNKTFQPSDTEWGLLGYFFYCFTLLFIFCNCADQVSNRISNGVKETLFMLDLKQLDRDAVREVHMFLTAIEMNSSVISLKGYASVDRSLITSSVALISGYLVVLIQFKVGLISKRYGG